MNDNTYRVLTIAQMRVTNHLRAYRREYTIGAVGLAAGLYFGKKLNKTPSFDIEFNKWLTDMVSKGYSVYALDPAQHNAWQALCTYAEELSRSNGEALYDVLKGMTEEYQYGLEHLVKHR